MLREKFPTTCLFSPASLVARLLSLIAPALVQEHMRAHNQRYARSLLRLFILFKRRHFDSTTIILCARCYTNYKLNSRDLRDMMAERGINLSHTTILRWVQHYVPEFDKKWNRFARPAGASLR
jgi:hypothetical protein